MILSIEYQQYNHSNDEKKEDRILVFARHDIDFLLTHKEDSMIQLIEMIHEIPHLNVSFYPLESILILNTVSK
jgi:hypothetical protein